MKLKRKAIEITDSDCNPLLSVPSALVSDHFALFKEVEPNKRSENDNYNITHLLTGGRVTGAYSHASGRNAIEKLEALRNDWHLLNTSNANEYASPELLTIFYDAKGI